MIKIGKLALTLDKEPQVVKLPELFKVCCIQMMPVPKEKIVASPQLTQQAITGIPIEPVLFFAYDLQQENTNAHKISEDKTPVDETRFVDYEVSLTAYGVILKNNNLYETQFLGTCSFTSGNGTAIAFYFIKKLRP